MRFSPYPLRIAVAATLRSIVCLVALTTAHLVTAGVFSFDEASHGEYSADVAVNDAGLKLAVAKPPAGSRGPQELPTFKEVKKIVAKHFSKAELAGATVISRSQVKPLFYALLNAGWRVKEAEEIYKLVPDDDDFIVKQLRTPDGVDFAKDVAKFPGAWDTIERLAKMPHGHSTIERLVKGPDGYKMIEYITTTPGGQNMATMLSEAPEGKDFKKPTGKVYTIPMLMDRLKQSYDAARAAGPQPTQTSPAT